MGREPSSSTAGWLDAEQRELILERARVQRARSQDLRAADVVAHAQAMRPTYERIRETQAWLISEALTSATAMADQTDAPGIARQRAARLGAVVGRDPAIEQAKDLLSTRFMVSRPEAFALLRKTSQRSNRKLSVVAHQVCDLYGDSEQ